MIIEQLSLTINNMSIFHPSTTYPGLGRGGRSQFIQHFGGDPKAFSNQPRNMVPPPACPGSFLEASYHSHPGHFTLGCELIQRDSFFSLMASLAAVVHQRVRVWLPRQAPTTLWPQHWSAA